MNDIEVSLKLACESTVNWTHDRDYKIIRVDDERALIFLAGNHRIMEIGSDLADRLEGGLANMTRDESAEWESLMNSGLLEDVNRDILSRSSYADAANLALNINLTGTCNLACTYCFAEGGDYGRIRGQMKSHTVNYIFDFIRAHVTKSKVVRFEFFGGEPLLNFPRIREICERSDSFSAETGIQFLYRISTNLTTVPAGALELFRDRKFVVSVSLDGGAKTHNANRPTKSGGGSFAPILANCQEVRRVGGDDVTMVARMTVVSSSPSILDNVKELWALNLFDYFQIYPGVTTAKMGCGSTSHAHDDHNEEAKQTMNPAFFPQLEELLEYYPKLFSSGNRFKGTLEYERLAEMVIVGKLALGYCSAGATYYTFSPDDSIVTCHRLVGQTNMQVGTGARGLEKQTPEWTLPVDKHPICSQCWARYACGGNCRQENFIATGDLRKLNSETCRYQLNLFEGVLKLIGRTIDDHNPYSRKQLDDLFVSCGRPVMNNGRRPSSERGGFPSGRHFRPLFVSRDETPTPHATW